MYGVDSNIKIIYLNNVLVSTAQLLSLFCVFYFLADSRYLLLVFACLYPWKAILNIVIILFLKRVVSYV